MRQLFKYNIMLLKTMAMSMAAIMVISGVVMIFIGTQEGGSIDLKAPFIEGKIKSGSAGILLIFMSLFTILSCFFFRYKDKIEIKFGKVELKTDGFLGEDRLKVLISQMKNLNMEVENQRKEK